MKKRFSRNNLLCCFWAISCIQSFAYSTTIDIESRVTIGNYVDNNTKVADTLNNESKKAYWQDKATYVFMCPSGKYYKAKKGLEILENYKLHIFGQHSYTSNSKRYFFSMLIKDDLVNCGELIVGSGKKSSYLNISGCNNYNYGNLRINNQSCLQLLEKSCLCSAGTIKCGSIATILVEENASISIQEGGTFDISMATRLYSYITKGEFKLEAGSTFILPKNVQAHVGKIKVNGKPQSKFTITLDGTADNPVNIVVPGDCHYININLIAQQQKEKLLNAISLETGIDFLGELNNVKFTMQEPKYNIAKNVLHPTKQHTEEPIESECEMFIDECE